MAYFKLQRFSGIAPGIAPRLLSEQFGQVANNIDFESGAIVPIDEDSQTTVLNSSLRQSVFFYDDQYWLEWDEDFIFAVEGPIPDDTNKRLYWTGEDYPRMGTFTSMISGSSYPAASYRLGVPAPESAPTLAKSGTPDPEQIVNDVAYVYTLVSAFGEEGPPSTPSDVIELTDTETVTITMPAVDVPSGNYNFGNGAVKRIYRSNSGSSTTTFQFVGEVAISATSFDDTANSAELGEVIPSYYWIGPPDDDASLYPDGPMQGLCAVANGIFAGFTGKRLCFSEAYLPHAWPITFRLTLEEDIVAIGTTNNGLACLTDGKPYFVTGTDPSAMAAVKIDLAQACINEHSVVDMGSYILYAGPDGLCAIEGASGEVVTRGLISVKQWETNFFPEAIKAFMHEGTYVALWTDGAESGGWVFDPRASEAAISTLTADEIRGGYMNPKDGKLHVIKGNTLYEHSGSSTPRTTTWRSKKHVTTTPLSYGWVEVQAEGYPVDVKVFGNGSLVADYTISEASGVYTQTTRTPAGVSAGTLREPIARLPASVAQTWEVEVSSDNIINEVCLAQSMAEIRGA